MSEKSLLDTAPYAQVNVTTTATALVSGVDPKRRTLCLQNVGATDCYIGPDADVESSSGLKLAAGAAWTFGRDDGLAKFRWYALTASGSTTVAVVEGIDE